MAAILNHYVVLEIPESFPTEEIPALRKQFARRFHPNGGSEPDEERLAQINESCDVLCDPSRREAFDKELATARTEAKTRKREARARAARKKRARSASQARSVREVFQAQGEHRQSPRPTSSAAPQQPAATGQHQPPAHQLPRGRWFNLMLADWIRLTSVGLGLSFIAVWFFSSGFQEPDNPLTYVSPAAIFWFVFFGVRR